MLWKRHRHNWSEWRDAEVRVNAAGLLSGYRVGDVFMGQTRRCTVCGLRQDRA